MLDIFCCCLAKIFTEGPNPSLLVMLIQHSFGERRMIDATLNFLIPFVYGIAYIKTFLYDMYIKTECIEKDVAQSDRFEDFES